VPTPGRGRAGAGSLRSVGGWRSLACSPRLEYRQATRSLDRRRPSSHQAGSARRAPGRAQSTIRELPDGAAGAVSVSQHKTAQILAAGLVAFLAVPAIPDGHARWPVFIAPFHWHRTNNGSAVATTIMKVATTSNHVAHFREFADLSCASSCRRVISAVTRCQKGLPTNPDLRTACEDRGKGRPAGTSPTPADRTAG
jgi:hypothetical protein